MANLNQFIKQAQGMQKNMESLKKELATTEYSGKAGGDLVTITINGEGEIRSTIIDISILKPEDKTLVEDLVSTAYNNAHQKRLRDSHEKYSNAFGGMNLPSGLPF